jgi:hypothetical protein
MPRKPSDAPKYYKTAGRPKYSQAKSEVEKHPDFEVIRSHILRGVSLIDIAQQFNLTYTTVSHYQRKLRKEHPGWFTDAKLDDWGVTSEQELAELRDETARGWLAAVRAHARKLTLRMDANIESGHDNTAVRYAGEVSKVLEMVGKSISELSNIQTLNITSNSNLILSGPYHAVRSAIIGALADEPTARAKVLQALRLIENEQPAEPQSLKLVNGYDEQVRE